VHATKAGVLLALTVLANSCIDPGELLKRRRYVFDRFENAGDQGPGVLHNEDDALVDTAKLGILAASLISGVVGWTLLRRATLLNQPG
jgi:hypothetical protein